VGSIGGEGVWTVRMGITISADGRPPFEGGSSSGKQMVGICREVGGLLLNLLAVGGRSEQLGKGTERLIGAADEGDVTGLGFKTSILMASSSSTLSLLLFRLGARRGVGAGEGIGVGTSLMGERHLPYSIIGISRRIVGGC